MFHIGDLIVHPMHGAGVIDSIVREKINGSTRDYYVFKMPMGGLLLKIPTSNIHTIGIRAVVCEQKAEEILEAIPGLEVEEPANWNQRYRENMLRLKSGDLYEVARVIKGLMYRDNAHGLSTGERKMLHNAKQILISELVVIKHAGYDEIETQVNQAMLAGLAKH